MIQLRIFNSIKTNIFLKPGKFSAFLHTQPIVKKEVKPESVECNTDYLPVEILRQKAHRIEADAALRSRCRWTEEETKKLMSLVDTMGKRWTAISKQFIDRSPSNVLNHYNLKVEGYRRGPWAPEELKALKEAGKGRIYEDIEDWESIQAQLPIPRPIHLIRQCYKHSVDPRIKHGRWTEEESNRLRYLVMKFGEENMSKVADLLGSRTKRQCLERWRWQMSDIKKGRFSPEEDRLILEAVEKYGENFAVICKVTGIQRTPRHVSQHYSTILNPSLNRLPWSEEEEEQVYQTCLKNNKDMVKTREILESKRAIRDMWNHFHKRDKLHKVKST